MSTLTKHRTVLHEGSTNGPRVRFSREPDELGDIPDAIYLPRDLWEDMGSPYTVTVTVEPGDLLNVEAPDAA